MSGVSLTLNRTFVSLKFGKKKKKKKNHLLLGMTTDLWFPGKAFGK